MVDGPGRVAIDTSSCGSSTLCLVDGEGWWVGLTVTNEGTFVLGGEGGDVQLEDRAGGWSRVAVSKGDATGLGELWATNQGEFKSLVTAIWECLLDVWGPSRCGGGILDGVVETVGAPPAESGGSCRGGRTGHSLRGHLGSCCTCSTWLFLTVGPGDAGIFIPLVETSIVSSCCNGGCFDTTTNIVTLFSHVNFATAAGTVIQGGVSSSPDVVHSSVLVGVGSRVELIEGGGVDEGVGEGS